MGFTASPIPMTATVAPQSPVPQLDPAPVPRLATEHTPCRHHGRRERQCSIQLGCQTFTNVCSGHVCGVSVHTVVRETSGPAFYVLTVSGILCFRWSQAFLACLPSHQFFNQTVRTKFTAFSAFGLTCADVPRKPSDVPARPVSWIPECYWRGAFLPNLCAV